MLKRIRIAALVTIAFCVAVVLFFVRPYYIFLTQTARVSPFKILLGINDLQQLNGRVNILLLGVPGGSHDGPNLSDSINVLSYDMRENKLTTIGVPRDIWSDTIHQKINAAYATGEAIEPGKGIILAKAEVSSIVGIPIHYAAVVRFAQFRDLIDYVGGIDVLVDKTFTDTEFPIAGKENDECGGDPDYRCRYESISFQKGQQHMSGDTALKYVRSRHATGGEGSDFSRNRRQQAVMKAIRVKLFSPEILLNPSKVDGLYKTIDRLVERDISNENGTSIAKNVVLKGNFTQASGVLPRDLFTVPAAWQYEGQYVLIPEGGSFDRVHDYVDKLLQEKNFSEDK